MAIRLGIIPHLTNTELTEKDKEYIQAIRQQYFNGDITYNEQSFKRAHEAMTDSGFGGGTHELAEYVFLFDLIIVTYTGCPTDIAFSLKSILQHLGQDICKRTTYLLNLKRYLLVYYEKSAKSEKKVPFLNF